MDSPIIYALAEMRRHQVVAAKLTPHLAGMYPDSYAYAIAHLLAPIFHDQVFEATKSHVADLYPFEPGYLYPRDLVDKTFDLVDAVRSAFHAPEESADTPMHYTALVDKDPYKLGKAGIRIFLRYIYLYDLVEHDVQVDIGFWDHFLDDPETKGKITAPFDPQELVRAGWPDWWL